MTRVSVVIPNWNGLHWLKPCLEALRRQSHADFQLVVVDNGSTDGSAAFLREHRPDITLCALPRNIGFAAGMNAGFAVATGDYVVALNNDTLPAEGWLAALVDVLDAHPEAGSAASTMVLMSDPAIIDTLGDGYGWTGVSYKLGAGRRVADAPKRPFPVFGACAGAAIYRRVMLDEIGVFDEAFFAYMEDVDLAIRARLAGWGCVSAPDAVVLHSVAASTGGDASDFSVRHTARNVIATILKTAPWPLLPLLLFTTLSTQAIAVTLSLATGRPAWLRRHIGAYVSGLRAAVAEAPRMLAARRAIQARRRLSTWAFIALLRKSARLRRRVARPRP